MANTNNDFYSHGKLLCGCFYRFGRKSLLFWSWAVTCCMGIIRSFSTNLLMMLTFEFLDAFFGAGVFSAGFILGRLRLSLSHNGPAPAAVPYCRTDSMLGVVNARTPRARQLILRECACGGIATRLSPPPGWFVSKLILLISHAALEFVGPDKRVLAGTVLNLFYSAGQVLLGAVAWLVFDWRWLLRSIYVPGFLCLLLLW